MKKSILVFSLFFLAWSLLGETGEASLQKYLGEHDYPKAIAIADQQTGDTQASSYRQIADAYLLEKKYQEAAQYYEKGGKGKEGYARIAESYLASKDYANAHTYYSKAGDVDGFLKTYAVIFNKCNVEHSSGLVKFRLFFVKQVEYAQYNITAKFYNSNNEYFFYAGFTNNQKVLYYGAVTVGESGYDWQVKGGNNEIAFQFDDYIFNAYDMRRMNGQKYRVEVTFWEDKKDGEQLSATMRIDSVF